MYTLFPSYGEVKWFTIIGAGWTKRIQSPMSRESRQRHLHLSYNVCAGVFGKEYTAQDTQRLCQVCSFHFFFLPMFMLNRNILVFNKLIPTTEWTEISFGWKVLPMVSFSQTNNRALGCLCRGFPKSTEIPRYIFKGLLYQHYINLSL